jgi:putative sigma-54 modulation protein
MKKVISFKNMDHSEPLELHANDKLNKIQNYLKGFKNTSPLNIDLHLKSNKQHPHHEVELNLKTPLFDLNAHDSSPDMYVAVDNVVDKIITQLKKEKEKLLDKRKKVETEKNKFASDKYDK